jgi:hypothetical protein
MPTRPLTEREAEILSFLLDAPNLRDRDLLRQQAAVASVEGMCSCGCATIHLAVDRAASSPASGDLPFALVSADAPGLDLREIDRVFPLQVYGTDGVLSRRVNRWDKGALGLILFVKDGWLSMVELTYVGDLAPPPQFPPPSIFDPPAVGSHPTDPPWNPDEHPLTSTDLVRLGWALLRYRLRQRVRLLWP